MKKILLFVTCLFVTILSFAHVTEIRVNQAQDGSLTWYLMTYHQVNECGHSGAGLTINGVNYPIDAEFAGNATSLSPTIFAAASSTYLGFGFNSYATVHTPFLGTTLSVAPYSNNVCWAFLVGGSGNFTPPPPPVCTSCPITGWSNTVTLPGNNNGTPCNPADDYTTASIRVNHLSCASITGTKSFKVIYDPSGANLSYGPFNYNAGVTTDVTIPIPYGAGNNTMVEVIDAAFPCQVTHGLSIPNGQYLGEKDLVPPTISSPAPITVNNDPGICGASVAYTVNYSDNCGVPTIRQTAGLPSGSVFPVGTTTNSFIVTDAAGNTASASFTVTVKDNEAPVPTTSATGSKTISVPYGNTNSWNPWIFNFSDPLPAGAVVTGASLSYTAVDQGWGGTGDYDHMYVSGTHIGDNQLFHYAQSFTINYNGSIPGYNYGGNNTLQMNFTGYPGWVGYFRGGTLTINYQINALPAVTAECAATITAPTAKDNCSGMVTGTTSDPLTYNNQGTYTIHWTYQDASGNTATQTQAVIIKDVTPPVITTAPGSMDATIECSDAASLATALALAPAATDNCSTATIHLLSDVKTAGCGSSYTQVRTWNFTDASGNTSANNFVQTITVLDRTAPVLSAAPANITVDCNAVPVAATLTATDNCDGSPVVTIVERNTQNGDINNAGHYNYTITRTWTATDACGNASSATQVIKVQDVTAPVLTSPSNISAVNDKGICGAAVSFTATASDNCGPVAITYSQNPGTVFPVGTTTVNITASDVSGNTTTGSFTVTVTDNEKPVVITKPVSVTLVNGVAAITASMVDGGSTDNCGIASVSVSPSVFHCANIGGNTVTLTVKDIHGNIASGTAVVTVIGEIPGCSIQSAPTNNVYTGGNANNLYFGYGPQSTVLQVTPSGASGNGTGGYTYTYSWSGSAVSMLSSTTSGAPVFAPTATGYSSFTVVTTNNYGCTTTCTISICVRDIRVAGSNGKVYITHAPPGNPANAQTLAISVNAVGAHLSNHPGDKLGSIDMPACSASVQTSLSSVKQSVTARETPEAGDLQVRVSPNPSATYFTLKLTSRYEIPVNMRVMDASGRAIEARSGLHSNSSLQVGENYQSGTYFAEFIQGSKRKVVQLIKARK